MVQAPYQPTRSLIHRLNARIKVIFTLIFILAISITPPRAWVAYLLFLTLSLSMSLISRLGIVFILKKALIAIPFAFAAIPLIINGEGIQGSIQIANHQIFFSQEGSAQFLSIVLKSWISIQAAILLVSTTPFSQILNTFNFLKVPKLLTTIVALMWRYLFVIEKEVTRMLQARSSRSSRLSGSKHTGGNILWRAKVTGGMAGSLFLHSIERSERVYSAMLARGYNGSFPVQEAEFLTLQDWIILILGTTLILAVWLLGIMSV